MHQALIERLSVLSEEEQRILRGDVLPGQTLVCDAQNGELVITAK